MQVKDGGGNTGRLNGDAAAAAAAAAAQRAAAEAAKRAAEAARVRAAAAAAKRAAEAAKQAAEAAKKHTGRLAVEAKKMDLGKAPWDTAAKAAATGVAALTGATAYKAVKDLNSVKKKTEAIQDTVAQLKAVAQGKTDVSKVKGSGILNGNAGKVLAKADGVMKVVGGVQSALNLKNSLGALKDGATKDELIQAGRDVIGTVRGADAVGKLAGKGSLIGKFNPVVAVAGASLDIANRANKMKDWDKMATKDKIANVAGMAASVADIVGAVTPPPVKFAAMGVSAGLSLVSLGAEKFDTIKAGAKVAAKAVDQAVDKGVEVAKDAGKKALDFGKKLIGGL